MAKLEGTDSLIRKLTLLNRTDYIENAVGKGTEYVRAKARMGAPTGTSGNLRQNIFSKTGREGTKITGTVYTNVPYAQYVEFGTGPKGQADHHGISPSVTPRYTLSGWMIPKDGIAESEAEKYHFTPISREGNVIGYYTEGQPAQPFMYPAIHDHRTNIKRVINREMAKKIKELSND